MAIDIDFGAGGHRHNLVCSYDNNAVQATVGRLYTTKSDFAELLRTILAQNQWQEEPVGPPGWFALLAEGGGDIYPQRHTAAIVLPALL